MHALLVISVFFQECLVLALRMMCTTMLSYLFSKLQYSNWPKVWIRCVLC